MYSPLMKTEVIEEPTLPPLQKESRVIGKLHQNLPGPTVIFTAGIHGNEPTGVQALQNVFDELLTLDITIRGTVYALKGNLPALEKQVRYIDEDLNRVWIQNRMENLDEIEAENSELDQQKELWQLLSQIINEEAGPFYFFDLHTTSCQTIPFLTVNDTLLNRKFTAQYPAPIILGIEEYLDGPLLSYVNELGYVAFGFEGGQHDDPQAIINHEDFVQLTLGFTGSADPQSLNHFFHFNRLKEASETKYRFYEIYDYQPVAQNDQFSMTPGYRNFQRVHEGELLAELNNEKIYAQEVTNIFMPLYQQQGDDGFFFVRRIPKPFLWLSKFLRKFSFLLTIMPGVKWNDRSKTSLLVNENIARFFTKQIFHLFGFRSKKLSGKYWLMHNRERTSRDREYIDTKWYS